MIFSFRTVNSAAAFYESIATITDAAWKNEFCHSGHHKRMIPATYISVVWLYKKHLSCRQPYTCRSLSWILAQSPPCLTLPHVTILPSASNATKASSFDCICCTCCKRSWTLLLLPRDQENLTASTSILSTSVFSTCKQACSIHHVKSTWNDILH